MNDYREYAEKSEIGVLHSIWDKTTCKCKGEDVETSAKLKEKFSRLIKDNNNR